MTEDSFTPAPGAAMMRRALLATGVATAACPATAQQARRPGAERQAMLMPGKRTLRQRVLTKPTAMPRAAPGAAAAGAALPPLSPLFVYARQNGPDGQPWIEVGRAAQGATLGWIPGGEAIDWPHTMTAAFQNPAGRERTLFFRERDPLVAMLGGGDPPAEAARLTAVAGQPPVPPDFPVVATEPATHIDSRRQFYLLPILQAETITFQDGREYRVLEVASVPVGDAPPPPSGEFGLSVAFLVDTTLSMDPYIDRVRTALNDVVKEAARNTNRRMHYALVGFRNSTRIQPRLDYVVRTFARFADNANPATFAERVAGMQATTVDSLSFNEDSFAAIRTSIQELDWVSGTGKVIVLVTDAGSRGPNDPASATGLGPYELGAIAREAGVAIIVLHLRTPQGRSNHRVAEQQYVTLSAAPYPVLGPQYFPVENGDADILSRQVRGIIAALGAVSDQRAPATPAPDPQGGAADAASQIGHAMRLAWLGRRDRAAAPPVLRAWASDRYRQGRPPENLEVRVLLTRNQLNDLAQALQAIVTEARQIGILDPEAMFRRLQSTAAALARNPDQLRGRGLQQMGDILGEFLDDLPYVSHIASLDLEGWRRMTDGDRDEIISELEGRLRAYEDFNRTPELWWPATARNAREAGEQMFAVPLALLP